MHVIRKKNGWKWDKWILGENIFLSMLLEIIDQKNPIQSSALKKQLIEHTKQKIERKENHFY